MGSGQRCVSAIRNFFLLLFFCFSGSEDRFLPHQRLADFLNWMPSTETQDAGDAEEIQESAEAALAATSQGICQLSLSLSLITPNKLID
jgi:hypothetical protein